MVASEIQQWKCNRNGMNSWVLSEMRVEHWPTADFRAQEVSNTHTKTEYTGMGTGKLGLTFPCFLIDF